MRRRPRASSNANGYRAGRPMTEVGNVARDQEGVGMPRRAEGSTTIDATHLAAMEWMSDHPEALEDYVDEWVAIADERVVAHGPSVGDVIDEAKRQGFDDPLLVPVLPDSYLGAGPWGG